MNAEDKAIADMLEIIDHAGKANLEQLRGYLNKWNQKHAPVTRRIRDKMTEEF